MRFKMSGLAVAALVAAASLAALGGCSSSKDNSLNLIASATSPIADVPIPAGFEMINDESTAKSTAGSNVRFVDHGYKGSDDLLPVVRFYREQMPSKGWTFTEQLQNHKEITLRYTKSAEDCTVVVTPGTFSTHIRVLIDAASQGAAK
jgi:hypothetical protein